MKPTREDEQLGVATTRYCSAVLDESVDWLRVDEALSGLERESPDLAKVVELKFFSGLKTEEIARVMGTSVATVGRQWRFAKAWLGEQLAL